MDLEEHPSDPDPHVRAVVELPGVPREDVLLRIEGGNLVVHGERKSKLSASQHTEEDPTTVLMSPDRRSGASITEIRYGRFRRDIPIPQGTLVSPL